MLLCVTANHKTAPFDLLERLSRTPDDLAGSLSEGSKGAVVLATCNRFEAYVDVDGTADENDVARILSTVSERSGIEADILSASSSVHSGPRVVEHLFSVASGLESVVSGEGEIAGQVRRALTSARKHGTTSPELERLFQRASEAQRKVKNDTALGRAGRSLVRLALDLADSRIADWSTARVLLVGTGAYAAVTLATLRERGAHDISVHSPSGRGAAFAAKHGSGRCPRRSTPAPPRTPRSSSPARAPSTPCSTPRSCAQAAARLSPPSRRRTARRWTARFRGTASRPARPRRS